MPVASLPTPLLCNRQKCSYLYSVGYLAHHSQTSVHQWEMFYLSEWPRSGPILTYYLRHRASLNHHHQGREARAFPPLCSARAHGSSRARRSELLRRRPWEGCTHTQESLLTLSKAPHGYVFAIEAKGERERCARSPSPLPPSCSKQPFLTISAEEGGRKGAVVMSDSVGA